ncbi:hypothetical protein OIV83_000743 [Microbotryomycetes sp. JL201]|nr:hypothetical protein OIV83_000743 [Microbotryomycetes sp. JL201]
MDRELPTAAHLKYFLATMYTSEKTERARKAFNDVAGSLKTDPSALEHAPTLVVLHNATDYVSDDTEQSGVDEFTSILALFMSSCQAAFANPPFLVLHDRQVFSLEMPVVSPRIATRPLRARRDTTDSSMQDHEDAGASSGDRINLGDVLSFFFDWTARAESRSSQTRQLGQDSDGDSRQWFVIKFAPSRRRMVSGACQPFDLTYVVVESDAAETDEVGVSVQLVG